MWYNRFIFTAPIYSIYLTDVNGRARLAGVGLSRPSPDESSRCYGLSAGEEGWLATETLKENGDILYNSSKDIQVSICVACILFMIK